MVVQFPCLVFNRTGVKKHSVDECDCVIPGSTWPAMFLIFIHIKNWKNTHFPGTVCCFLKMLPYGSIDGKVFLIGIHSMQD